MTSSRVFPIRTKRVTTRVQDAAISLRAGDPLIGTGIQVARRRPSKLATVDRTVVETSRRAIGAFSTRDRAPQDGVTAPFLCRLWGNVERGLENKSLRTH